MKHIILTIAFLGLCHGAIAATPTPAPDFSITTDREYAVEIAAGNGGMEVITIEDEAENQTDYHHEIIYYGDGTYSEHHGWTVESPPIEKYEINMAIVLVAILLFCWGATGKI